MTNPPSRLLMYNSWCELCSHQLPFSSLIETEVSLSFYCSVVVVVFCLPKSFPFINSIQ